MIRILRSNENYHHFGRIDTSDVAFFETFESDEDQTVSGIYSFDRGNLVCLFSKRGNLYLRLESKDICLNSNIKSKLSAYNRERFFSLLYKDKELIKIEYNIILLYFTL